MVRCSKSSYSVIDLFIIVRKKKILNCANLINLTTYMFKTFFLFRLEIVFFSLRFSFFPLNDF